VGRPPLAPRYLSKHHFKALETALYSIPTRESRNGHPIVEYERGASSRYLVLSLSSRPSQASDAPHSSNGLIMQQLSQKLVCMMNSASKHGLVYHTSSQTCPDESLFINRSPASHTLLITARGPQQAAAPSPAPNPAKAHNRS